MRLVLNTLFLLLASGVVVAQDNYQVTAYGVDDGLPQSSIWHITQDRNGFLWAGTSDGLCRFDGYNFTVYKNNPKDPSSICGNRDHRFYVDKQGNLWIVCWNGINLYNEVKDNFSVVFTYDPFLPTDNFNTIFGEDEQYIWVGLSNCGLVKVDKGSRKASQVSTAGDIDLRTIKAWASGFVDGKKIWLTTGSTLLVYDTKLGTMSSIGTNHQITTVINLNDSEVMAGGDRCVEICNKNNLTVSPVSVYLANHNVEIIADMLKEANNEVILACHKGLFYYNIKLRKIVKSIRSFDTQQKNKYAYARCLYKDKADNLWIGTNGDGLKKINYPYKNFLAYNSHSEVSNLVKCIYADSARVYVGYFNSGMDVFSRKNGFERKISFSPATHDVGNSVYALTCLGAGVLIIHTAANNKICSYDIKKGAVTMLNPSLSRILPGLEEYNTMYPFLIQEKSGRVLTVVGENIIALNEPHSTRIQPSLFHRFSGEMPGCCFEDSKGALWVGTMNCIYHYKNEQWGKVSLPENVQVKCVNEDADGNLWVGTVKGIYVLDSNNKVVSYFSEANGLVNQFIYGILRDDDGNMWFSHNKGLSVYRPGTHAFRHYYKDDGLQSSEFNTNSYFKTKDGMLFFGGINGINAFNPREIRDNPHVPDVKITSIKLFDEALKTDTAYWNIHTLSLPYTENSLSFEFAALEYSNPKKNQYAYFMEGLDKDWIKAGDKRFARYAALPPGQYVFKVKASNNDGVWQQQPAVICITIIPPVWEQLWFRVLAFIFFACCIAGIFLLVQRIRYRRQMRLLELQQKIQLERERISRDLHDNVGTQLSLISNNIEWVTHPLKKISEGEKEEKLQFVNDAARGIISTLRETIWALNKEHITLEEFADKLKSFVQKQLVLFPQIHLHILEEIHEAIVLGPSEALNLFRICQEAIANALKYSCAPEIKIKIQCAAGRYTVSIADNGKGFDPAKVKPAVQNGLENMRYRAGDIGCELEISTANGRGTRIVISKK